MSSSTRLPRPPACLSCSRGWDVVPFHAHGLCTGCYSTQRYLDTVGELVRQPMPERCTSCGRKLRHKRAPKSPGTVGYAGKGMCGSCWNKAVRRENQLLAYVLGTAS